MRDLAIVGGGPVGLCAALALQRQRPSVTVVEAGNFRPRAATGLATRSIALSVSSVQILRALGLWSQLKASAAPIRHIHVSARGRWGVTRLCADDYGVDALGYVVESETLSACLYAAVQDNPQIELLEDAAFESVEQDDAVEIGFSRDGERLKLRAKMALIADGARSQARAALGIDHQQIDYGQAAVISNVEAGRALSDTAYERFCSDGPLALLPLGGKRYACVWTLSPQLAEQVCSADEDGFLAQLQNAFGYRLGMFERASPRFALPLQRTRAEQLVAGRCLLIGNAANALHPVAGQSFNLSLRDVACLYELMCEAPGVDPDEAGIVALGAEYQRQREREQSRVIRYGDGLVNLFSNDLPLLGHARAAGLGLLDLAPALKTQAAFAGMGLTFGGNRLLRGHL